MLQILTSSAKYCTNPLLNFFQREIYMPTTFEHAIITRETLPDILEFIEIYDHPTQKRMIDIVIAKNPRIREFFQLYLNTTFTQLGEVDYEMPRKDTPGISNLYRQLREIRTLAESFVWPIEKKRQQFKVIASSLSIQELMILENVMTHTLEDMYKSLNWEYLKEKYQLKRVDEVVTIVDPSIVAS